MERARFAAEDAAAAAAGARLKELAEAAEKIQASRIAISCQYKIEFEIDDASEIQLSKFF